MEVEVRPAKGSGKARESANGLLAIPTDPFLYPLDPSGFRSREHEDRNMDCLGS